MNVDLTSDVRGQWETLFGRRDPRLICIGLNYHSHAEETELGLPTAPLLFAKFSNTLCASGDGVILPAGIGHVDAEAELAVVIGRTGHAVSEKDALSYVFGYTCANDLSARDAQFGDGQWFRGKGYDTFCPIGPRIVGADEIDPSDLRVEQRLNGETLQDGRTRSLIFSIPELIAYVSAVMTLEPGDLILTGTPEGVGYFRDPKIALTAGDVIEVEVEGIGVLQNTVREARPGSA
jgi:2,4-didehydro-3-deoxy-L-rhamnonate hydrolase